MSQRSWTLPPQAVVTPPVVLLVKWEALEKNLSRSLQWCTWGTFFKGGLQLPLGGGGWAGCRHSGGREAKLVAMAMVLKEMVVAGTGRGQWRCWEVCVRAQSLQSCLTLCHPMDCSPPGSSVRGILQARILWWVAMPSSRGSSWPRDPTRLLCLLHWQVASLPIVPPGKSAERWSWLNSEGADDRIHCWVARGGDDRKGSVTTLWVWPQQLRRVALYWEGRDSSAVDLVWSVFQSLELGWESVESEP